MEQSLLFKPTMTRKRPAETELDLLETERAKRRYVSEYLSSELTALSIRKEPIEGIEDPTDAMDVDDGAPTGCYSPSRRKHVVLVTDLEDTSESEESERESGGIELLKEVRKSLGRIPKEILKTTKTEQPSMALVKYQRPSWWPPESSTETPAQDASTVNNKQLHAVRNIIEIANKQVQILEPTDVVDGNGCVNGGYFGDDDNDYVDGMDL